MKLADVQNLFQNHMTRTDNEIDQEFAAPYETGKIPLDARLRVYRDNVVSGLAVTMAGTFPTIAALCGTEFTLGLLRHYIRENLPQSGWLEEYGADIPGFITTFPPAKSLPYLPDIARLEWYLSACEHAPDDNALKPEDLQKLQADQQVELKLRNSAYLMMSDFPLLKIRDFAHDSENENKEPPQLNAGKTYMMVYRPYLKAELLELSEEEYFFLKHLESGATVAQALRDVLEVHQRFDFNVFFQKFFEYMVFRS